MKSVKPVLLCTSLLVCFSAVANENQTLPLPTVVVLEKEQKPDPTRLEMDNQGNADTATDIGERLRAVSGISASRMGGHGLDPVFRGQQGNRINVLIDGVYGFGACPNRMDPPSSLAALESYDRIIVLKGVQTLEYATAGSAGTILLERDSNTRQPGFSANGSVSLMDNSDEQSAVGEMTYGDDGYYLKTRFGYKDKGNYRDGDGRDILSAFHEETAGLEGGLHLTENQSLAFSIDRNKRSDTLFAGAGMDSPYDNTRKSKLRYLAEFDKGFINSLSIESGRVSVDHLMDNYSLRPLTAAMMMSAPSDSKTDTHRLILEGNYKAVKWKAGSEYQQNNRSARRYMGMSGNWMLQSVLWPDASIRQAGFFAELTTPLAGSISLTTGARIDRVKANADKAGLNPMNPMLLSPAALYEQTYGTTAIEAIEDNISTLARVRWDRDNAVWFAGLSRTMRTADATERYLASNNPNMPMMQWVGNPTLAPEKHLQLDFGSHLSMGNSRLQLVAFVDEVEDYILRDRARGQTGVLVNNMATIYRNTDARLYGLEADFRHVINPQLSWQASLAYTHGENRTDNRPLAQIPPLNGRLALDWQPGRYAISLQSEFAASQNRVDDKPMNGSGLDAGPSDAFVVFHLHGSYSINKNVSLDLGIRNLFDETYAWHVNRANSDPFNPEAVRVNEPGRSIWLKMNLQTQ